MASFATRFSSPSISTCMIGRGTKSRSFPLRPFSPSTLAPSTTLLFPIPNPIVHRSQNSLFPLIRILSLQWHLLLYPLLNLVSTNTGPTLFSAKRLEKDWNISANLDGSLQISSPKRWKVLLLSNDIGESRHFLFLTQNIQAWFRDNTTVRYCIQLKEDYVEYLLSEDKAIYMNFFDWMYKTSRKKLLQSYDEYWRRLCQYFGLFARRRVNGEVHEQMRRVRRRS